MMNVLPFPWTRLTESASIHYRVNERGQIVVRSSVPG